MTSPRSIPFLLYVRSVSRITHQSDDPANRFPIHFVYPQLHRWRVVRGWDENTTQKRAIV